MLLGQCVLPPAVTDVSLAVATEEGHNEVAEENMDNADPVEPHVPTEGEDDTTTSTDDGENIDNGDDSTENDEEGTEVGVGGEIHRRARRGRVL